MLHSPRRLLLASAAVWATLLAAPLGAAVPGSVNFQGLLLDSQGDPVTGPVDLVLRLYDAAEDGSLLWTESHAGVDVLDGVYTVELGATTPLTPAILDTPALYLEVEVEGDTLAPRQRLLAVPYALRAESADNVASLPAAYVTQLIEHVNLDGGGPPNLDPSEGLADPDGDGIANFVDPDNDNDGLSDIAEVAQGSDINLVTPTISGFDPPTADGFTTTSVEVQGTHFIAPLAVVFGSETPTPTNVTSSSFQVDVGPQAEGTASVQVTNANGEVANSSFPFFLVPPVIDGFLPPSAAPDATTSVHVSGADFLPGFGVSFGAVPVTPYNVTATGFDADVGPNPGGAEVVTVTVTNPNGKEATAPFEFGDQTRIVFITAGVFGTAGGVAGADALCASEAAGLGLTGTYLAWIADGVSDPASRFPLNAGPYVREADGVTIADDWADLTDGTLDASGGRQRNGRSVVGCRHRRDGAYQPRLQLRRLVGDRGVGAPGPARRDERELDRRRKRRVQPGPLAVLLRVRLIREAAPQS
jgi:hypothetical protein